MVALEAPVRAAPDEPILTAATLALAGLMIAAMSGFYLLLSAVPAHIAGLGGDFVTGLATSALMVTTIAGELFAARIIARVGRSLAMILALLVLAIPSVTSFSGSIPVVLLSCAARGLGLGILLVAACGLAATLAPPTRRAEAMGIYGVASAIPAILCIPLGPWALAQWGPGSIAAAAAVLTVTGIACIPFLPRHGGAGETTLHAHCLPALRTAAWPTASLALGAVAIGATVTFLPLAHRELGSATIMLALLLQGLASATTRWGSGRHVDRHGPQGAMVLGIVLAASAILMLAFHGDIAVLGGMVLSGIAFGVLQTASLAQLLARATARQVDGASALWNAAYDAGLGVGGFALGALATASGYAAAFATTGGGIAMLALVIFRLFEAPRGTC